MKMNIKIDEIITARLAGEKLTQEEETVLLEWLKTRPEHQKMYKKFEGLYESGTSFRHKGGLDRIQAWRNIAER